MNVEKNVKKSLVKIKVLKKVGSTLLKSSMDVVSDKVCLASYRLFDPYTSSVYETMMCEQLKHDEIETKVAMQSFKLINETIDEMV